MIGLQNTTYDGVGTMFLREFSETGEYVSTARIARHKLLDGGTFFSHLGVTDTDRDFPIECRLSTAEQAAIKAWYESGAELMLTFWEGCFLALIADLRIQRGGLTLITFYFKEKIQ
jgi:hypothetical protein